ncbi:hypothetical protein [Acetilactobacillus jinshanensis]|uniref:Uncharacterized protein n=1 Tax=Acetilactobacillus jinshanensis TaxID=1720083 RepID=A0A4P6ZLW0_9LACO|nr:hypothetical protein [Acetilactobacillus jinshanensis]QBP18392.1 hypothetical protein ELX58_04410 [Acetilactobacillus jinshanensis]URL61262.1 hypothetical protein HGK75_04505 [uncultured bacterium]
MMEVTLGAFKKGVKAYQNSSSKSPQTLARLMSEYDDLSFKHNAHQAELNKLADSIRVHES